MKLIPERSWQPGSLGNQELPWRDLAAVRSPSPAVRGPQDPQPTYARWHVVGWNVLPCQAWAEGSLQQEISSFLQSQL